MKDGTTLLEVLIAITVTAMIASISILYSGSGRAQMQLYVETVTVAQTILKAKSLAVSLYYNPTERVCGYGMRVQGERAYAVFRYMAGDGENCDTIASVGDANYAEVERGTLADSVRFEDAEGVVTEILFVPPDPRTILWSGADRVMGSGEVRLRTKSADNARSVTVNTGGQVTF